jgi:hypothetical protein
MLDDRILGSLQSYSIKKPFIKFLLLELGINRFFYCGITVRNLKFTSKIDIETSKTYITEITNVLKIKQSCFVSFTSLELKLTTCVNAP